MIPGCLRNAAVTTVWRKRNEPGCRISNFPSPTFTRADGRCKKSNFPSLSFALADIWRRILNFPSLFEREQIRKVQNLVQTQRKRGLSPVFAFGKFEFLHQTRKHSHGKRKRPAGASELPPIFGVQFTRRSGLQGTPCQAFALFCMQPSRNPRARSYPPTREAHPCTARTKSLSSRCEESAPKAGGAACSPAYTASTKGLPSMGVTPRRTP